MTMLGIGIALNSWTSLTVLMLLPIAGYIRRIHVEETALAQNLGKDYTAYAQRTTRRLVPGVW